LHNIAQMYARRRNWNRALEAEEEAARIFAYAVGESNELTVAAEAALKEIQKSNKLRSRTHGNLMLFLGSGVISRFLSKSVDLPTMPHVGRIITDNGDSTPMRKPKALVDVIYPPFSLLQYNNTSLGKQITRGLQATAAICRNQARRIRPCPPCCRACYRQRSHHYSIFYHHSCSSLYSQFTSTRTRTKIFVSHCPHQSQL
jgi:hypothetical protein